MSDSLNQTPLYNLHVELGAKMVDFAGWSMPVQYSGIIEEHTQCREKAALFDVSYMGQVELRGDGAATALEALVPSNIDGLKEGKARPITTTKIIHVVKSFMIDMCTMRSM